MGSVGRSLVHSGDINIWMGRHSDVRRGPRIGVLARAFNARRCATASLEENLKREIHREQRELPVNSHGSSRAFGPRYLTKAFGKTSPTIKYQVVGIAWFGVVFESHKHQRKTRGTGRSLKLGVEPGWRTVHR